MVQGLLLRLKGIVYKLIYRNKVRYEKLPKLAWSARLNIQSGSLRVGSSFSMKPRSYIAIVNGGKVTIGKSVSVNRNCIFVCHDTITICENCSIGPNVVMYDHDHKFGIDGIESGYKTSSIVVEKNCWIGANVTILRGTHIGEGCVIGAGTVVKGIIPPHSLVTSDRTLSIEPIGNRE